MRLTEKLSEEAKRKWPTAMGNRMVTWPMTSSDLERSRSWPQYALGRKHLESSWRCCL